MKWHKDKWPGATFYYSKNRHWQIQEWHTVYDNSFYVHLLANPHTSAQYRVIVQRFATDEITAAKQLAELIEEHQPEAWGEKP